MVALQNRPVAQSWTIPVKNTFINFDLPPPVPARCRASTCPPIGREMSWEEATQELCHAMSPSIPVKVLPIASSQALECGVELASRDSPATSSRSPGTPVPSPSPSRSRKVGPRACAESPQGKDSDAISDISTTSSEALVVPIKEAAIPDWTSVASRKKVKGRGIVNTPLTVPATETSSKPIVVTKTSNKPVVASKSPPAAAVVATKSPTAAVANKARDEAPPRSEAKGEGKGEGKGKGKGKGLSHFQRVEVGIDDDKDFRIVQRLIGPRGRFMQDIVVASRGAKVWIIGKGSRSWEDDVGPLQVCIGAASTPVFESAMSQVQELLDRVRAEHKRFSEK